MLSVSPMRCEVFGVQGWRAIRAVGVASLVFPAVLGGCPGPSGGPNQVVTTPSATTSASSSPTPPTLTAATGPGRWLQDEPLVDAVLGAGGTVAVATKRAVYTYELGGRAAPAPLKLALTTDVKFLVGNRRDRFAVVTQGAAFVAGAAATAPVEITLDAPASTGDLSQDGTIVAFAGCPQSAKLAAGVLPKCISLFDGKTGVRTAVVTTPHDVEWVDFTPVGSWLLARGGDRGLSLIDAKAGKVLVTVPGWNRVSGVHSSGGDVAEVVGNQLVVGSRTGPIASDGTPGNVVVEGYELATGKRTYRLAPRGAYFAGVGGTPARIAIVGDAVSVFDADSGAPFTSVKLPSMCTPHCVAEFDDLDADRLGVFPRYDGHPWTVSMSKKTVVEGAWREAGDYAVSAKHRVTWSDKRCLLVRRDRAGDSPLAPEFCRHDLHHRDTPWPGFDRAERFLVAFDEGHVVIEGLEPLAEVATLGRRAEAHVKP